MRYDLIVIGGGPAGYLASVRLTLSSTYCASRKTMLAECASTKDAFPPKRSSTAQSCMTEQNTAQNTA